MPRRTRFTDRLFQEIVRIKQKALNMVDAEVYQTDAYRRRIGDV
ncbi:MAG: hypothetical protein ACLQGU_06110 [bacterium]